MDSSSSINNGNRDALRGADPHGHAALLLVESLIHCLVEKSAISGSEALDVVSAAVDATEEIAADLSIPPLSLQRSIVLLGAISESLAHDK